MQVSIGLSTCISRDLSRKPALCNAPMIRQLLKKGMRDMALTVIKNANLALSFFLELCVLVALGYWGFQTGQGTIAKIGLGIGAPVVAVVVGPVRSAEFGVAAARSLAPDPARALLRLCL